MYSGYGIKFHSTGSWSFNNDTGKNVTIFVVKNSSSSYADNQKNNFLALSEVPTPGINGSFDSLEKKFSTNFAWDCVTVLIIIVKVCLIMAKKSLNSKPI